MYKILVAGLLALVFVGCRVDTTTDITIDVTNLSEIAEGKNLSVKLERVYPWCDHMPIMEPGERRQHLMVEVDFQNKTNKELKVSLEQVYLSFNATKKGELANDIGIYDKNGSLWNGKEFTLANSATTQLEFWADNQFKEGNHNHSLYVTFVFTSKGEKLIVRGSGIIQETM